MHSPLLSQELFHNYNIFTFIFPFYFGAFCSLDLKSTHVWKNARLKICCYFFLIQSIRKYLQSVLLPPMIHYSNFLLDKIQIAFKYEFKMYTNKYSCHLIQYCSILLWQSSPSIPFKCYIYLNECIVWQMKTLFCVAEMLTRIKQFKLMKEIINTETFSNFYRSYSPP